MQNEIAGGYQKIQIFFKLYNTQYPENSFKIKVYLDEIYLDVNDDEKNEKIKEWWDLNIDCDDNDDNKLTSTEIWTRFKKDNKEYVDENKLLIDDFKNYVKIFIDVDKYNEKSKKGSIPPHVVFPEGLAGPP